MSQTNQLSENKRTTRERVYLSQLRRLPPFLYGALVRRMVKGDSIRVTAKFLGWVRPDIGCETARKWLAALAKEISRTKKFRDVDEKTGTRQNESISSPFAINRLPPEARTGRAPRMKSTIRPEPAQKPKPPRPEITNRSDAGGKQLGLDPTAGEKLNYVWAVQMRRVHRVLNFEQRTGLASPLAFREIRELRKIAEALIKKESSLDLPPPAAEKTVDPVDPMVQRIAALNFIDRNLIREAASKVVQMIEERASREYSRANTPGAGIGSEKRRNYVGRAEGSSQDGKLENRPAGCPKV